MVKLAEQSEEIYAKGRGFKSFNQPTLRSLQLGMSWFAERPGGLDRYYFELIRHLPAADVDVSGLVVGSPQVAVDSSGSVVSFAKNDAKMWTRWAAVRRAVAAGMSDGTFDLVASHHSLYTFPVLSLIKRVPLVVHFHGPYASECWAENSKFIANSAKYWMERAVYRRASRCITLSEAFAKILHETYGVARERIRVVPGGVESDRFNPTETRRQARERLNWPVDRPIVFCIRRIFRRMGLENLIAAVEIVRQRVPDVLVLIAGKGWLAGELQQQIASAGLKDHVRLLGFVPDVDLPLAYRAADLSVVPTVSLEGFGLTTVESLAAGTPALVAPVGGLPEVVRGLSNSLIMAGSSAPCIAESIIASLVGDLKLPTSDQCREYACRLFNWSNVARQVRAVYEEAIEVHRLPAC